MEQTDRVSKVKRPVRRCVISNDIHASLEEVDPDGKAQWQVFRTDKGVKMWKDVEEVSNRTIEKAFIAKHKSIQILNPLNNHLMKIEFAAMEQTDLVSKVSRSVRRCVVSSGARTNAQKANFR